MTASSSVTSQQKVAIVVATKVHRTQVLIAVCALNALAGSSLCPGCECPPAQSSLKKKKKNPRKWFSLLALAALTASPLSHEGPAGRPPPAAARRWAGLPPGTSSAPLRRRLASPCKDYLCGSSNPVSRKREGERDGKNNKIKKETRDSGNVISSPSHSNVNQAECPVQRYVGAARREKAGIDRFGLTSNMGWAPRGFVSSLQMLNFAFLKCGELLTPSELWLWDSWLLWL